MPLPWQEPKFNHITKLPDKFEEKLYGMEGLS